MTNTEIDMPRGQFDEQHPAGHTAKLLREAQDNVTVMLQAADLLRGLGYDNMAIALHVRTETTRAAIANAAREEQETN